VNTAALIIIILAALILGAYLSLEGAILPRQSTQQFFSLSDLSWGKKLEGYLYATRTREYLKMAKWQGLLKKLGISETADSYHGKVMTRTDAGKLITLNVPIEIPDLDRVIPYPVARSIILNQPLPSIAVMECPCRAQKQDSCPRDVCLVVGEPFASFMLEHRPDKVRRIETEEALQILDEEEERGHIHTAWFKDAMHNRFYVICNCCTCCCLGMASFFRGVPRMTHSGYIPIVETDSCTGCGMCEEICPFQAISLNMDIPHVNQEGCMGCGLCTSHCPTNSIRLTLAPERGIPLDVEMLV
jgi:formate hydrogenlyase subunit 6/NADH:ubiquinone oxidoreductase subunit I